MHTHTSSRTSSRAILTCSIAALAAISTASAADIFKADNLDSLDLTTSWVGGITPGFDDVAIWNSTVTSSNSTLMGLDASWGGIRILNPGGAVDIQAGNTLTLGRFGIDMAAATQDLAINSNVALLTATRQEWAVAAGRTLNIGGSLTRGAGATINFNTAAGGTINSALGTASALLGGWATINKTDFAALDATRNVVNGSTVIAYTPNANTGAALPNMSGTVTGVLDVVNSNTNATSAFRLSNTLTVTGGGIRFNTPHSAGQDWTVDVNTRNLNVSSQGILVTENVGVRNVIFNGSTGNLRLGTNTELLVHQHNTLGDLIFNAQVTQPAGAGSALTKTGAGRLILQHSGNSYLGPTRILEGTLQIGNGGTTGAINTASTILNDGTFAFNRTDTITFSNPISGPGQVTQAGSGVVALTGGNGYTGATNFNAGTLEFTTLANLGSGTALNFNGGALRWAAANAEDISVRTVTLDASGGTLNTNGNNVTLAGAIGNGGAGGLTKAGAGTLTLADANSYSGPTNVSTGTLLLANPGGSATGSGDVSVASGAILGGTGTSSGTTTIVSGGILSPGASIGTLTLGGLTLSAGSILDYEFDATAAPDDSIATTLLNGLTINGGGFHLYQVGTNTAFTDLGTYNLFSFSGAIQGTGIGALSVLNTVAGYSYSFGISGNLVRLTIASSGLITAWDEVGGGTWGDNANWTNTAPNIASATANFHGAIAAPSVITLDGSKTVGALSFNNASGYTIAQGSGGSLTLDKGVDPAAIDIIAGSHTISAPIILASNLTVNASAGATLAVSGAISGARALTKTGDGALVLTGVNSYANGTNFNGGAVEFTTLDNLGSGDLTFGGGALRWAAGSTEDISMRTVTFGSGGGTLNTNGNDVTLFNPVGNFGSGGLTKAGAGTLTLTSFNTYLGATTITGGKLSVTFNDNLGDGATGAAVILNGGTLGVASTFVLDNFGFNARPITVAAGGGGIDVDEFMTLTVPGTVTGSGPLTKAGLGTLALNANNAFTLSSPITIEDGAITLGGGDVNGQQGIGTGAITFRGGSLTMNGHFGSTTPGYGNLGNPIIVPTGETGTVRMTQRGGMTSALSGDGTFNLVVNYVRGDVSPNWNAFTGQINVTTAAGGAEFRIANFVALNIPNARLNLGDGVTMFQTFNPPTGTGTETVHNIGELSGTVAAFLGGNPVAGRFANWTVGALGTNSVFAGTIGNSAGAARLTKVGAGTLELTGANTFTGRTLVNDGTLALGNVNALQGSTLDTGFFGAQQVTFTVAGPNTYNIGGLQGSDDLDMGANSVSVGANNENTAFSGAVLASGTLTKAGAGTLTLSGANVHTGPTVVSAGTLKFTTPLSLYSATPANWTTANITVAAGATLGLGVGFGEFSETDLDVLLPLGTATNGFTSGSFVALDTTAGDFTYNSVIANPNGGANVRGLTKLGLNTLTLNAANIYSGLTTVTQGTLVAPVDSGLGSSTAATAGLSMNPAAATTATVLFTSGAPAIASLASSGAGTSNIVLGNGIAGTPTALTVGGGNASTTFAGSISDETFINIAAIGSLTKVGAGKLTLSGTNTYTGATLVSAGTLQFATQAALYNNATPSWTTTNITVNSGATLALNVGGVGQFTAADLDLLLALGTATSGFQSGSFAGIDTTAGDFTYGTVIANPNGGANTRGLAKLGTSILTLTAANNYSGGTRIEAGALNFAALNNLGTGGITFDGGALIWAAGNTADISTRAVALAAGGGSLDTNGNNVTLANSIGGAGDGDLTKLGAGALTLNGAANYTGDTTVLAGTLNLNTALTAGTTLNANGGATNISVSQTLAALNIADGATVVLGASPAPEEGLAFFADGGFDAGATASQVAAVPESGAASLLLTGVLGLLGRRRRCNA